MVEKSHGKDEGRNHPRQLPLAPVLGQGNKREGVCSQRIGVARTPDTVRRY